MATRKPRAAFTLVELLVVVIIVGVLAGVGIPLLTGQIDRARASEGEAGLGTIRSGLRAFFAENETYTGGNDLSLLGINVTDASNVGGDLDGRYFDDGTYSVAITGGGTGYCIQVNGAGSIAPRSNDVNGDAEGVGAIVRSMTEDGEISRSLCPAS